MRAFVEDTGSLADIGHVDHGGACKTACGLGVGIGGRQEPLGKIAG